MRSYVDPNPLLGYDATQPPSPTEGRLSMAGEKPVQYHRLWHESTTLEDRIVESTTTLPETRAKSSSPTGLAGAEHAALRFARDPVAEQAVKRTLEASPVRMRVTERWDGVVVEVDRAEGFFTGRLVPVGSHEPELLADFRLDRVDHQDIPLVGEGALFYAITGYIPVGPGQRVQASSIRFRRLPRWKSDDVLFMEAAAKKWRTVLGLDDQE